MKSIQRQHDKDNRKVKNNYTQTPLTAGSGNITFLRNTTKTINQWQPFQPTDLGPTHIGINPLHGPETGDQHEAYLLLTDKPWLQV